MFRSLNSRLLLSYVGVILVCLALVGLGLFLFVRASPLWTNTTFTRLETAARTTVPTLLRASTMERFEHMLAQAAEEQQVRMLLLDDDARVRFDSAEKWQGEQLEEQNHRLATARGGFRGTFVAPNGGRWTFFGQPVPTPDGERQTLLFVSPPNYILMLSWFVDNLLPPVLQAGVVALVLSILPALLISRSIVAPLRRVAGAAEAIARGETNTRAPLSGPTEVQGLARSFNVMVDQVESAQQSQRDFVANVSHELKTPLTSIQGFSQALLDGTASTPETTDRAARVIHEEADRMHRMVDNLLTLARFDAGQMVMARVPVEIRPLLRGCIEKLAPQAQAAGVALEMDDPGQLFVTGDADRLAQVFANLLDNGVAHTPDGGRVTMAARRAEDDTIEITVTDVGAGIPPESLTRIFERFYQVDKARKHSRGAGLGLAITREIVVAHGGAIAAESVLGLGSRFTVRLPAQEVSSTEHDDRGNE